MREIVWEDRFPFRKPFPPATMITYFFMDGLAFNAHRLYQLVTFSLPTNRSTIVKANSIAAPGPIPVMMFPSRTRHIDYIQHHPDIAQLRDNK